MRFTAARHNSGSIRRTRSSITTTTTPKVHLNVGIWCVLEAIIFYVSINIITDRQQLGYGRLYGPDETDDLDDEPSYVEQSKRSIFRERGGTIETVLEI